MKAMFELSKSEYVKFLLENDEEGNSPLHLASKYGQKEVITLLMNDMKGDVLDGWVMTKSTRAV